MLKINMEDLSELVTSYDTLSNNQEPSSNPLEKVANTQVPPLPSQESSDNKTPPELPNYQTQNRAKRFSRRGLIAGGIISGLAILLYKGYNDRANARIEEAKRKTREEERKRELERQTDIEMHKLTDSEFAEYMRLNKIEYSKKSKDEQERLETLTKKIDAIKKSPSKALSLMDDSTRREYESFKRNQNEFDTYFLKIRNEFHKNNPDDLGKFFGRLMIAGMMTPYTMAADSIAVDSIASKLTGKDEKLLSTGTIWQAMLPRLPKEESDKLDYILEYNRYNSAYNLTSVPSNSDKDLILYFYYTRYKGGRFTKRLE